MLVGNVTPVRTATLARGAIDPAEGGAARGAVDGRAPSSSRAVEDAFERQRSMPAPLPVAARGAPVGGLPPGPWSFSSKAATGAAATSTSPPDGPALARALSDAITRCVRARPATDDALLVDKLSSFVFTDTARDFIAAVRRGESPQLTELPTNTGSLDPADTRKPRQFHMLTLNGRTSWGGMACFHGDIFPEGFYRTRASISRAPLGLEKDRYIGADSSKLFEQPYFRWESGEFRFCPGDQQDNANLRIIEHLVAEQGEKVSLWRGTSDCYDTPAELRVVGDDGRYAAGGMSGFGDEFASVMTTPDRSAAENWAHPTLLRFEFTGAELKDLARQGLLYAGIEFSYVEMAFLYDRDPAGARGRSSVDRMTVAGRVEAPDANHAVAPRAAVDNPDR
jgi:hypothetical protein